MFTIKQRVRVGADGQVAARFPELHEGESAEVIVMVERPTAVDANARLVALAQLRENLKLSAKIVDEWEESVAVERAARTLPAEH